MRLFKFGFMAVLVFAGTAIADKGGSGVSPERSEEKISVKHGKQLPFILDMVHHNLVDPPFETSFMDPQKLVDFGYTGQVFFLWDAAQFGVNWDVFDRDVFPAGSQKRRWVLAKAAAIEKKYQASKAAGLNVYCMNDMLVLPRALVEKYRDQICDDMGKIDIHKPFTQKAIRSLIGQIFDRFSQLDGLVVRTGETYLHKTPFYVGNRPTVHEEKSHILLLSILREEICVKRNKTLIYRTWDFGKLHTRPDYYLTVTDAIEPHPNLIFSIKYPSGDFNRMTVFNPTITLGKHPQIVEFDCQSSTYGKCAYPYYHSQSVIEGFSEYKQIMKPSEKQCLLDVVGHRNIVGVWTWSRGGGHRGPYIKNEMWCELEAYVMSQWARNPGRSEKEIFYEYARKIGINSAANLERFREIATLSATAVLLGHDTLYCGVNKGVGYERIPNVGWARAHFIGGVNELQSTFDKVIREGNVENVLAEKVRAVEMWRRMEKLSRELDIPDEKLKEFIETSCSYGRINYEIFEKGWTIMLLGYLGDKTGEYDTKRIGSAIVVYDRCWNEWRQLRRTSPSCATISQDSYIAWIPEQVEDMPGIAYSVDKYRRIIAEMEDKK